LSEVVLLGMSYTIKKPTPSTAELTITAPPAAYQKYLAAAAERLSTRTVIKGFRPGKTPYEVVKRALGEMAILQEALEGIVQESFNAAVKSEGLETVGSPKIEVEKLAPGNDVVYRATVGLFPRVTVADVGSIHVAVKSKPVEEAKVAETLEALRGLHATEAVKAGPATGSDKLVIDMDMFLDKVPIESGQAKNYQVYLGEDHYIPGFNEQVAGLQKDGEKEFSLDFPPTHYQKMLAGKKVDFKVKVKDVYERTLPELSDALAQKLGQTSLEKLKDLVRRNLTEEAEQKAGQTAEIEILEQLIAKSNFEQIPEVIIDAERQKIFFELKRDLERHGVEIEQYLLDLKKTEEEMRRDFTEQAEKRAKAALISRQIALEQDLKVSDEELEKEIALMRKVYRDDAVALENLLRPEVKQSIATALQNKKVMAWLKEKIVEM